MSASALINVQQADGSVKQIYLHNKGNEAASVLRNYYADPASVQTLLALGNLSWLGISPAECDAYARDRGEADQKAVDFCNIQELVSKTYPEGYNYFYINNTWLLTHCVKTPEGSWEIDIPGLVPA